MKKTYVTKQGDLWDSIAFAVLGDTAYTPALIWANRQYRGIYAFPAGVVLTLPQVVQAPVDGLPPWKQAIG